MRQWGLSYAIREIHFQMTVSDVGAIDMSLTLQWSSIISVTPQICCSRKVEVSCFCKVGMSHSPRLIGAGEIADGTDSDERA